MNYYVHNRKMMRAYALNFRKCHRNRSWYLSGAIRYRDMSLKYKRETQLEFLPKEFQPVKMKQPCFF